MSYGQGPYGQGGYGEAYSPPTKEAAPSLQSPQGLDFAIEIEQGTGAGMFTFNAATNIMNNIYLSLMIPKKTENHPGGFFQNPDFGSRLHELMRSKRTPHTEEDAKEYCREALQWIIDTGRASRIDIYSEWDGQNINRLNLRIEAFQADGRLVTFDTYLEVL